MTHSSTNRTTALTFILLLVLILSINLGMIFPFILSILVGVILALLCHPLYVRLNRRIRRPWVSSALIMLGVILLVIAPFTEFIRVAVQEGMTLQKYLSKENTFWWDALISRIVHLRPIENWVGDPQAFSEHIKEWVKSAGKDRLTPHLLTFASGLPERLLKLGLALLTCFFLLVDGEKLLLWMRDKVPLDAKTQTHLSPLFQTRQLKNFKKVSSSLILPRSPRIFFPLPARR